ncbi:MAG: AAA family ATPase [Peptococcaceae bacterium]|nr:AAA family ATPase [Peptococcaceae bacterium]
MTAEEKNQHHQQEAGASGGKSDDLSRSQLDFLHEKAYLEQTKSLLHRTMLELFDLRDAEKQKLAEARESLAENQPASAGDPDNQNDTGQYLTELENRMAVFQLYNERLEKYSRLQDSPYFGRIDFAEEGFGAESFYIGRQSLRDPKTYQIQVCDWRTPLASLFYQCLPGEASYVSPAGKIRGRLLLKRQYEIRRGELKYFFDTDLHIKDDILKTVLSQQASPKMRAIVETLQETQDRLIRNRESRLLMIQGSAGSGKTSLALHRAAYLMYQEMKNALSAKEIIIISPNHLFTKYIDRVLPELGEENIASLTFEDVFLANFSGSLPLESRREQLDRLLGIRDQEEYLLECSEIAFKSSAEFALILRRLADYYERRIKELPEFYYHGQYIATSRELREELLRDRAGIPLAKRLGQMRSRLSEKLYKSRKARLPQLEDFTTNYPDHQLEVRSFARLLSMKRSKYLNRTLEKLTEIDAMGLYQRLFTDRALFDHLAKGIRLPENIEDLLKHCRQMPLGYNDAPALTYLRVLLEGSADYPQFRQVMVDEAQDYGPLHFLLLRKWFPRAEFTVLGDVQQSLAEDKKLDFYEQVAESLGLPGSPLAVLKETYRSTAEISAFCRRLAADPSLLLPFDRRGPEPALLQAADRAGMVELLTGQVKAYREEGLGSIAIITKTGAEAEALYRDLAGRIALQLVQEADKADLSRSLLLPVALAKGLEFDAVILWDAGANAYSWPAQRNLLYVAVSRALHRLALIYQGPPTPLLRSKPAEGK